MMDRIQANPIGRVYVTQRNGGVTCRPAGSFEDLGRMIEGAFNRRLEAVAYSDDDERRLIGRAEEDPDGRWIWWHETAALQSTGEAP